MKDFHPTIHDMRTEDGEQNLQEHKASITESRTDVLNKIDAIVLCETLDDMNELESALLPCIETYYVSLNELEEMKLHPNSPDYEEQQQILQIEYSEVMPQIEHVMEQLMANITSLEDLEMDDCRSSVSKRLAQESKSMHETLPAETAGLDISTEREIVIDIHSDLVSHQPGERTDDSNADMPAIMMKSIPDLNGTQTSDADDLDTQRPKQYLSDFDVNEISHEYHQKEESLDDPDFVPQPDEIDCNDELAPDECTCIEQQARPDEPACTARLPAHSHGEERDSRLDLLIHIATHDGNVGKAKTANVKESNQSSRIMFVHNRIHDLLFMLSSSKGQEQRYPCEIWI